MKNITVIIPNYNGEKLLEKHFPKVLEAANCYKNGKVEIIIVDDASKDNSVLVVRNYLLGIKNKKIHIRILENKNNLGFSSTVNRGVDEAIGEIILLLNTDVIPQIDLLNNLAVHFDDPMVFAVGCMEKSVEKGKIILRGRGLGEWKRGFLIHRRGDIDEANTLWVNGGSGAFRKKIWQELGGFNNLYNPFYWEDIDLSYRALKSGYKILFDSSSIVWHYHEQGAIKSRYSSFQIKTIAYKNQFIFVWGNITDISLQMRHIFWLPYHFVKALYRKDWEFFLGFYHAFLIFFPIMVYKSHFQKHFIKKDIEILSHFK